MITRAKQAIEQESEIPEIPSLDDVLKVKKNKIDKLKNNQFLNCPKCNRSYKKQSSLDVHVATCKGKTVKGGARKGSGRKPGAISPHKIVLNEQKKLMQERIAQNVDKLLNAQMNLALGQTMLFVKVTERDSKGKPLRTYHERVESESIIKEYLDDPESMNTDENYYYIATRPANNMALSNLLDRAFGKPKENVELSEDPDAPVGKHGTGTTTALREAFVALVKAQVKSSNKGVKGGKN